MKRTITILALLMFSSGLGVAQSIFIDTLQLVNLCDGQYKRILYSFEKKARKKGMISKDHPCFVEVNRVGPEEMLQIIVEDHPIIATYHINKRMHVIEHLHPYKAAHQHDDFLFLFSFVDSSFMEFLDEYKVLDYSEFNVPHIFIFDTMDFPEMAKILSKYQQNNSKLEDSLRNTVISVLNRGTIGPLMREWWNVGKRRMHKHDHVDIVPAKNDQVWYQDETLTIYYHKE